MATICLNLVDGTCVVGKCVGNSIQDIELEEALLLTTTNYTGVGTKVYLTKYNIFGDEPTMKFNRTGVISEYKASKYIRSFYKKFLEKAASRTSNVTEINPDSETPPTFLTEFEEIIGHGSDEDDNDKIDIEDLRKNVERLPDHYDEDDDDDDDIEPNDGDDE